MYTIFGSNGFIGSELVNYLKKNKYISVNKKKLYNLNLEDKALKDTIKIQEKNILSLSGLFSKIYNQIDIN